MYLIFLIAILLYDIKTNMRYLSKRIVLQEVPDEISLSYLITWCPLRCKWCHSTNARNPKLWTELTIETLTEEIKSNKWITCVLFFWGEWEKENLIDLLYLAKILDLKTALYTWLQVVDREIMEYLDYLKVWPYIEELWWLDNPKTNQKMYELDTYKDITYKFWKWK